MVSTNGIRMRNMEDETSWLLAVDDRDKSSSNTTELASIARRYGFEALYEQSIGSDKQFKWKSEDVIFNNTTHHTDFHDDYNRTFCYLCSINQHEHQQTKPRDESQRRKLIPYKNPKARLSFSASARTLQNPSSSELISYRFVVRTGTQKNSGTRAQVFLYIYGTENNWISVHLQGRGKSTSSASIDSFPSGSVRTFSLKGPDIGQLHHLNVNLVGARSNKEWFLKEIEMTNLNTSIVWLCEFNCWLPKTNEQEVNQIKPAAHRSTELALSMYILQIRTGDKAFASPDAHVYIVIRGSKSSTGRIALTSNRAKLFEQNQLDTLAIVGVDLGDLLEITVESDRSQLATEWDIKEMVLWKIIPRDDRENYQVYFPLNTSLGKKVNRLKSKGEIYPSTDHHFKGPICYQVNVKTGQVTNGGTDANVFLILYGSCGRTVIHQLNNRLKNDFERGAISEFMIMGVDIGKIDRIKIWHDNSGVGPAWFLDSVVIRKKYSTCSAIANIYTQRIQQISNVLYRKIHEHKAKESTMRTSSINEDGRRSVERQSFKSNEYYDNGSRDRLGSSRGILRSPTVYDKASLQKKVTWDELSIGSQDDLSSTNSQRSTPMRTPSDSKHKKEDSLSQGDHQAYWISSHNYIDHQWKIASIEETNSFHLDSSTRALLLSDRSAIKTPSKTSIHDRHDEIYECPANRWLAKDKEDGKLEVYLSAITSEQKNLTAPKMHAGSQHQKHDDERKDSKETKRSLTSDLGSIKKPPQGLTPYDLHSAQRNINPSSRPNVALKQQQEESPRTTSSVGKLPSSSSLTQLSKSPRYIHNLTDSISTERELLARITGEPPKPSRTLTTPSISSNQRLKSVQNLDERQSSLKPPGEPANHPRLPATTTFSSNQRLKSPRSINDLTAPAINERQSLRSNKELTTPLLHSRESLAKISHASPNDPRLIDPSMSSHNQPLKSPRHLKDLMGPLSGEPPPPYRSSSSSPTTSLTPLNQRTKSPRNIVDPMSSSTNERDTLGKTPPESFTHSRLPPTFSFPSKQLSKTIQSSNDSSIPPTRGSIEPLTRPKSSVRSNPKLSSQKSIHDQVYNSAYDTIPSDDF